MVYAVPEGKNRVTARTVYTEVRVNRGEGVFRINSRFNFLRVKNFLLCTKQLKKIKGK